MSGRMREITAWQRWGRPLAAATAGAVIAWFPFLAGREVPLFDLFDLAIHEAGHLVAMPLPRLVMFLAGSVAQVAFPVGMAAYFGYRRRDGAAASFCLVWAGTAAWDVSVYAGDAVRQSLPLVGGGEHDWAYILGPRGFDVLPMTESVAGVIEATGAMLAIAGIGVALGLAIRGGARRVTGEIPMTPDPVPDGADPWVVAATLPFRHGGSGKRQAASAAPGAEG